MLPRWLPVAGVLPRWLPVLAALAVLAGVGIPGHLEAASPVKVMDLLPREISETTARDALSGAAGAPVTLVEPDPELLEALRWASPDPARTRCQEAASRLIDQIALKKLVKAPTSEEGLYQALIEQAAQQILYMDLDAVLETLTQARSVLPCTGAILPREQVRALFFHEAVAHLYRGDGQHPGAFQQMLAVDDRRPELADYPTSVRTAYVEAETKQLTERSVPLDPGGLQGQVFVDGQAAATMKDIRPGTHVLQVRGPFGGVRTALVTIAPLKPGNNDPGIWLANLADFGLPRAVDIRNELTASLVAGQLRPIQADGLDRYLVQQKLPAVAFAVAGGGSTPELRVYQAGGGLTRSVPRGLLAGAPPEGEGPAAAGSSSRPAPRPDPGDDDEIGPQVGLGLGLLTLQGTSDAFSLNGRGAGYMVRFEYPLERLVIGGRLALIPHLFRSDTGTGCGSYDGSGEPSAEQVEAAMACVQNRTLFSLGAGAGYSIPILQYLRFIPSGYYEGLFLPNTLIRMDPEEASSIQLADVWMSGPMGRARLAYEALEAGVGIDVELEVAAGVMLGRAADTRVVAVPLGVTLGVGVMF